MWFWTQLQRSSPGVLARHKLQTTRSCCSKVPCLVTTQTRSRHLWNRARMLRSLIILKKQGRATKSAIWRSMTIKCFHHRWSVSFLRNSHLSIRSLFSISKKSASLFRFRGTSSRILTMFRFFAKLNRKRAITPLKWCQTESDYWLLTTSKETLCLY